MPLSKDKHRVLILCVNPYIRIEFQDYLHSLLGDYVLFDTAEPNAITDSVQLEGYSCIKGDIAVNDFKLQGNNVFFINLLSDEWKAV